MEMLQPDPQNRLSSLEELLKILGALDNEVEEPAGKTLKERAIQQPIQRETIGDITLVGKQKEPTEFFDTSLFLKSTFFQDESIRFTKIQETLQFYRDHLNGEYQNLLKQANLTYRLWITCVVLGFLILLSGVVAMLVGYISEGAATAASTIIIYFIQRVFQQREEYYRTFAKTKNSHLEYGNQWLLVIQSIDSIEDPAERSRRQSRLVEVLTNKLSTQGSE
jgi:Cyanobacterial TRADD-N associated 2-Transmembrane domain